jgi:hypothetical protein
MESLRYSVRLLQTIMANRNHSETAWRRWLPVCAVVLASLVSGIFPPAARADDFAVDRKVFDADMAELTKNPNRLAGREDGSRAASRFVEKRLTDMGLEEVYVQEFPVVIPRTTECRIEVDGKSHPMNAIQPNLLQASITPEKGLEGESLYVGKGSIDDYGNRSAENKIVFIDFDCGGNWSDAFAFGARAVVFIGEQELITNPTHYLNISANLPRFHISPQLADELGVRKAPRMVKLFAAASWERLEGRNVIGVIRAERKAGSKAAAREAIVLAAGLDSYSEVPELSPGARDAANVAILLQTAQSLLEHRPNRDVVVAFFDGQRQSNMGARAFYGALYRRYKTKEVAKLSLDERMEAFEQEKKDMLGVSEMLATPGFPGPESKVAKPDPNSAQESKGCGGLFGKGAQDNKYYGDARRMLVAEVRRLGNGLLTDLRLIRLQERDLKNALDSLEKQGKSTAEVTAQLEALKSTDGKHLGSIDKMGTEDWAWNSLLRLSNNGVSISSKAVVDKAAVKLISDPCEAKQKLKREYFVEAINAAFDKARQSAIGICQGRVQELDVQIKQTEQSRKLLAALGVDKNKLILHISVNLGDAGTRWSFVHGDHSIRLINTDNEGLYGSVFKVFKQCQDDLNLPLFDERGISLTYNSRQFVPTRFADSTAPARWFGRYNVSVMTLMDGLQKQGLPADTVGQLDTGNMLAQANEFVKFMGKLGSAKGLPTDHPTGISSITFHEPEYSNMAPNGYKVYQADSGDAMRAAAVPGAVIAIQDPAMSNSSSGANNTVASQQYLKYGSEGNAAGFIPIVMVMSQSNGIFEYGPVTTTTKTEQPFIADFDREDRVGKDGKTITVTRGRICSVSVPRVVAGSSFPIVRIHALTLVGYGYDRGPVTTTAMYAISTSRFRADRYFQLEAGNVLALFAEYTARGTKLFNKDGMVLLNNEPTRLGYQGKGYPLDDEFAHPPVARTTARDMRTLNEYRLGLLRANQIGQESLEKLNGQAADTLADASADSVRATKQYFGMLEASGALSRRVYAPLREVMDDLVTAVVLLLLLAIPFAFALERLFIGTPHIYRQIGWFAALFLATFGVLYMVNPAFKLASTPIIIFLAFTIILLSSLVIFIMFRKLESEMQKLKGLSASAHSADVSRVSTMMAAVQMGISTMRRRPIRTILTAATVTLLTFTILTFASFGSSWGNRKTYKGTMTPPPRVLVRYPFWTPIQPGIQKTLEGYLTGQADVVPMYWVAPLSSDVREANTNGESIDLLITTADTTKVARVSAVLSFYTQDLQYQETIREKGFVKGARLDLLDSDGIFLTQTIADQLGLSAADIGKTHVLFKGQKLTFGGFVADDLSTFKLLDGSSILPVDYAASTSGEDIAVYQTAESQSTMESDTMQFISFSLDSVVVTGGGKAHELGGEIRAINIYPKADADLDKIADDVSLVSGIPTYLGSRGGVYRLFYSTLVEASGFRDLIIPIVLGGLIIFATMLGSVADREREIYTFSSLGLGPAHVAGLFFAEASVYAVVGGMGGYLLGQVVAKATGIMAEYGLVAVPSMNFSSTNAIVTIFVVMCTVLLSTIYPAVKASKSANPGIQRQWKIGEPKGDIYDIKFPFTVSAYDLTGIVSFLEEHFNNYRDAAVGVFTTIHCEVVRESESDMLGIRTHVALAPFDLGIEQTLLMLSQPSDVEGIDEVRVIMRRESGAYNDWRRANRVFVNDLRKQFLIWRSLDTEVTEKYREITLARWNDIQTLDKQEIVEISQAAAVAGHGDGR